MATVVWWREMVSRPSNQSSGRRGGIMIVQGNDGDDDGEDDVDDGDKDGDVDDGGDGGDAIWSK